MTKSKNFLPLQTSYFFFFFSDLLIFGELREFSQKCQKPAWRVLQNRYLVRRFYLVLIKFLQIPCSLGTLGVAQLVQSLYWKQFQPPCLNLHMWIGRERRLFFLPGPGVQLQLGLSHVWALWSCCVILPLSPLTPFCHKLDSLLKRLPMLFFSLGCRICFFPLMIDKRSLWRDWILKRLNPHYQELIQNIFERVRRNNPFTGPALGKTGISCQVLVV